MSGRIAIATLITLALAACGPEPRETNNVRTPDPNNQSTNNNSTNNTNNNTTGTNNNTVLPINAGFGPECAGVECPDDRRCVRGTCVLADLLVACEVPEDLGTLDQAEVYMGTGDNSGYADGVVTSCAGDRELSGSENAIVFTVDEPGIVDFEITSTDSPFEWVIESRSDCADRGERLEENNEPGDGLVSECSTTASTSLVVEPGGEYWLVVEPNNSIDTGTFEWVLTFEPFACQPGRVCQNDGTLLVCRAGVEEEELSCGTSCEADACAGDSCDSAIEVTAGMSWSGDALAFRDTLDFESQPTCSQDGTEGIPTPGPELILSLPGLTAGQRVIVDASMMDANDNAIFVLSECSDAVECLAAQDLSDYLEWDVPADGDYFVVIDKLTNSPQTYNYTIDIQ